jgi:hypothetical protein
VKGFWKFFSRCEGGEALVEWARASGQRDGLVLIANCSRRIVDSPKPTRPCSFYCRDSLCSALQSYLYRPLYATMAAEKKEKLEGELVPQRLL